MTLTNPDHEAGNVEIAYYLLDHIAAQGRPAGDALMEIKQIILSTT